MDPENNEAVHFKIPDSFELLSCLQVFTACNPQDGAFD